MPEPYGSQLVAICEMLKSPQPYIVQRGYDLLFVLWLEYSVRNDFGISLERIAQDHPRLAQEFTDRLNAASLPDKEKAALLKAIILLYPRETVAEIIRPSDARASRDIPRVFISYSHNDEPFKNELIIMLAGLQRHGVLDIWQDRRIEPGSEWLQAISKAMEECNIAVLLISPDFIASRFIQERELTRLLQRRIEGGLCVVPIIIRPCLWDSEPVIKDLQALPKDAKSVISFSKENGDRDQIWVDIGRAIENIAKAF